MKRRDLHLNRRAVRTGVQCIAVIMSLVASETLLAAPQIQSELTYVEHRPPDDIFGFPGLYVLTRCDATDPNGVAALIGPPAGATVSCNNNDFPFTQPTALGLTVLGNAAAFIHLFPISEADFPDVSGQYTYVVTNNNNQNDSLLGHRLNRMEVVPLPTNVAASNQTTTPTITFTDPDPSPNEPGLIRRYQVVIYDTALNFVTILPTPATSSTNPSMAVPSGTLCPCVPYYFRAQSIDLDTAEGNAIENMGQSFLLFTPTDVPIKTGDSNHDCLVNGRDIAPFIVALQASSGAVADVCPSDFNLNGMIDLGDVPGFVQKLLAR